MPVATTPFLARDERFASVGSTNDIVKAWLREGTREVCRAVADEQTQGRGRHDRTWVAPPGSALLQSIGFRPTWLAPERTWRLAAIISLAMADAAEAVAGLDGGAIRLKWPNDLVIEAGPGPTVRKLAGVLGESEGLGTADPSVIVGIGVNVDWAADAFPVELASTMSSLRVAAGRAIDRDALEREFLARLERQVHALRDGRFDGAAWSDRQVTTGRSIRLETADGSRLAEAVAVDPETGALLVRADPGGAIQAVQVGEVVHVRPGWV